MTNNKKPKLLLLKGLPASGKTTYAQELVEQGWVRANKDDIRAKHFPNWKPKQEAAVIGCENGIIRNALREGKDVVVDNTHFHPKHEQRLKGIAKEFGAEFELLFIDTPLEDCIKRNSKRKDRVPVGVITTMYSDYILPLRKKEVKYDDKLEEAIIVDVDGTLAHSPHRNPYDASLAMDDILDDAVANIVNMAYRHGYKIIILTGRSAEHREVTEKWLDKHKIGYDEIYTRADGDRRPDWIVKKELYEAHIKGRFNVKYVIDDRPQVCRMWESEGLKLIMAAYPWKEF